jgi:hypothetical protein
MAEPIQSVEAEYLEEAGVFVFILSNGQKIGVSATGLYRLGSLEGKSWSELLEELPNTPVKLYG